MDNPDLSTLIATLVVELDEIWKLLEYLDDKIDKIDFAAAAIKLAEGKNITIIQPEVHGND